MSGSVVAVHMALSGNNTNEQISEGKLSVPCHAHHEATVPS